MKRRLAVTATFLLVHGMMSPGRVYAVEDTPRIVESGPLPSEALALPRLTAVAAVSDAGRRRNEMLSAEDQVSLGQATSCERRAIRRVADRRAELEQNREALFLASNPHQHLIIGFTEQGPRVSSRCRGRDWQVLFRLSGHTKPQVIAAKGTRLEYSYGNLIAWYDNRSDGLEQGFILTERPPDAGNQMELHVEVEGLLPRGSGHDLVLEDSEGQAVLSYSKLKVWDIDGRSLVANLTAENDGILITVSDAHARYPITIDPLIASQETKLRASDGVGYDYFGTSVSIAEETALVGAQAASGRGDGLGSAYIFEREAGNTGVWAQAKVLAASDRYPTDRFGCSASLSGESALVGAYQGLNTDGFYAGSAYVFVRSGTNWVQQAKLVPLDIAVGDHFGEAVFLSGDTAIIGAPYTDDRGDSSGSAYIFSRSGSVWTQRAKLVPSDGGEYDLFGTSVSLSGDTALVGAYGDDRQGFATGSAYVFTRTNDVWTQQAKLTASDGTGGDVFGFTVSLSGDTAIVGAFGGDSASKPGSAYVFVRSGTNWSQQAKLTGNDATGASKFGRSVSLSGDVVVIGDIGDDDSGGYSGSAYIFARDGNAWSQQVKLTASDGAASDVFGISVSLSEKSALVGSSGDDGSRGSAYVFSLSDYGINQDVDNDSIDDLWEVEHGMSFADPNDATNNPDGDAFDNLAEYIADTDPTNSASLFELESITVSSPVVLSWDGSTARVYNVDYRTNLLAGNWQSLVTGVPGSNVMGVVHDTNVPAAFYRIGVSLP